MRNITVEIMNTGIEIGRVVSKLNNEGNKDILMYVGEVRDHSDGREVQGVSYLADELLAESTLLHICREAQVQLAAEPEICLVHRIGYVDAGDISIAIAVGSGNRKKADRVFRHIMEGIKSQAPFKRKEYYGNGDSKWLPAACL